MAAGAMKRLLFLAGVEKVADLSPAAIDAFEEAIRRDERERLGVTSPAEVKRLRKYARMGDAIDRLVKHYKRRGSGLAGPGFTSGPTELVGKPSYARILRSAEEQAASWDWMYEQYGPTYGSKG